MRDESFKGFLQDQLRDLGRLYFKTNPATHVKASVSRKVGGKFTAFEGALIGRNLAIIPKRMIVQSWRGSYWKKTELDSILILTFSKVRGGGRITLVHANVPDKYAPRSGRGGMPTIGHDGGVT